jgi:hypothetical protein
MSEFQGDRRISEMQPVRMRFAKQCVDELRRIDPSSRVSVHLVRCLAKRGVVASVQIGNRNLINFDALLRYLEDPSHMDMDEKGIRRISE